MEDESMTKRLGCLDEHFQRLVSLIPPEHYYQKDEQQDIEEDQGPAQKVPKSNLVRTIVKKSEVLKKQSDGKKHQIRVEKSRQVITGTNRIKRKLMDREQIVKMIRKQKGDDSGVDSNGSIELEEAPTIAGIQMMQSEAGAKRTTKSHPTSTEQQEIEQRDPTSSDTTTRNKNKIVYQGNSTKAGVTSSKGLNIHDSEQDMKVHSRNPADGTPLNPQSKKKQPRDKKKQQKHENKEITKKQQESHESIDVPMTWTSDKEVGEETVEDKKEQDVIKKKQQNEAKEKRLKSNKEIKTKHQESDGSEDEMVMTWSSDEEPEVVEETPKDKKEQDAINKEQQNKGKKKQLRSNKEIKTKHQESDGSEDEMVMTWSSDEEPEVVEETPKGLKEKKNNETEPQIPDKKHLQELRDKVRGKIEAMKQERKNTDKNDKRKEKIRKLKEQVKDMRKEKKKTAMETKQKLKLQQQKETKEEEEEEEGKPNDEESTRASNIGESKVRYSKFNFEAEDWARKKLSKKNKNMIEKQTGRNYKVLIDKAERKLEKYEDLKERDPEGAVDWLSKEKWRKAVLKAEGTKVKDDPDLLKKSLKRREKTKDRSRQKIVDMKEKVAKAMKERQLERYRNLQDRKHQKKAKKVKRLQKRGKLLLQDRDKKW